MLGLVVPVVAELIAVLDYELGSGHDWEKRERPKADPYKDFQHLITPLLREDQVTETLYATKSYERNLGSGSSLLLEYPNRLEIPPERRPPSLFG